MPRALGIDSGRLGSPGRLRDNEKDEQQRLAEMPEFHVLNRGFRAGEPPW
jgi:hypothetical protein